MCKKRDWCVGVEKLGKKCPSCLKKARKRLSSGYLSFGKRSEGRRKTHLASGGVPQIEAT